jgi:hypothetical protein
MVLGDVVYCESMKGEVKIKPTYECRCDERLQTKTKRFTCLLHFFVHWVGDERLFVYYESIKRGLKRRLIY